MSTKRHRFVAVLVEIEPRVDTVSNVLIGKESFGRVFAGALRRFMTRIAATTDTANPIGGVAKVLIVGARKFAGVVLRITVSVVFRSVEAILSPKIVTLLFSSARGHT